MLCTYRARVDEDGTIRLLEPVRLKKGCQVLITFLDHETVISSTALLSEDALDDWLRPEEKEAWAYLAEKEQGQ
jgi:predicted DNA-binding antitoxin AbrB/MazE fold protein